MAFSAILPQYLFTNYGGLIMKFHIRFITFNIILAIIASSQVLYSDNPKEIKDFGFTENWQLVYSGLGEIANQMEHEDYWTLRGLIEMDSLSPFGVSAWSYVSRDSLDHADGIFQVAVTEDNGDTWDTVKTDLDLRGHYIGSLDIYSKDENTRTVYITCTNTNKEENIFLKSKDNCKSWVVSRVDSTYKNDLALFSKEFSSKNLSIINDEHLLWCFWGNVLESKDGGTTWHNTTQSLSDSLTKHQCVFATTAFGSRDSSICVTVVIFNKGAFFISSTDFGDSWDTKKVELPFAGGHNAYISKNKWYIGEGFIAANLIRGRAIKVLDEGSTFDTLFTYECLPHPDEKDYVSNFVDIYENERVIIYNTSNKGCFLSQDYGKTFDQIIKPDDIVHVMRPGTLGFQTAWSQRGEVLAMVAPYNVILKYNPNSSIETDIEKFNTKIYPNPAKANSKVYVSLENDKQRSATCKVFNLTGELIEESQEIAMPKGCHTLDFETDGYITGTYFLVIESNGEMIAREKFVVE